VLIVPESFVKGNNSLYYIDEPDGLDTTFIVEHVDTSRLP